MGYSSVVSFCRILHTTLKEKILPQMPHSGYNNKSFHLMRVMTSHWAKCLMLSILELRSGKLFWN